MRRIVTIKKIDYSLKNDDVALFLFHEYFFKLHKSSYQPFEKSNRVPASRYQYSPLFLPLYQWQISEQLNSLIEVHYAQIKRNPE
jgi:hypothetical protein